MIKFTRQARVKFSVMLPCLVEAFVALEEDGTCHIERVLDVDPEVNMPRAVEEHIDQETWDEIDAQVQTMQATQGRGV